MLFLEKIVVRGILYIGSHFDETTYGPQFDLFYNYFTKTWMKYYDPMHWNINHVISQEKEEMEKIFIYRNSNPLERFTEPSVRFLFVNRMWSFLLKYVHIFN